MQFPDIDQEQKLCGAAQNGPLIQVSPARQEFWHETVDDGMDASEPPVPPV